MATTFTAGAATTVDYDAATRTLNIKGEINDGKSSFVTISVFKSSVDLDNINENSTELGNALYKTVKLSANGGFEETIVLPTGFDNGEYALRTYGSELADTNYFNYISDISAVDGDVIEEINGASTSVEMITSLKSLGVFEQSLLDTYGNTIGSYVLTNKPQSGYDAETVISSVYNAIAMAKISRGEITLEQGLLQYSSYVDVDYDTDYATLASAQKDNLSSLFTQAHGVSGSFVGVYNNLKATANLKSATSFEDLQSRFLTAAAANGISLTDYNALSDNYKRDQSFVELYETIYGAKNLFDVKNLFDTAVSNQANSDPSGGGAGGSGGGAGGSGGGNSGGGISIGGGPATYIPTEPVAQTVFVDTTGHWSESYIKILKEKNVINGFEDGTFRPDGTVTRAELVKMLTAVLGIPGGDGDEFADVTAGNWFYAPVYGAYNKGIVNGTSAAEFSPNAPVTRQDAAVMISRAYGIDAEGDVSFADSAAIADYAVGAVAGLSGKGIINGYSDNTFRPGASLTRGETAAILSRIIQVK